MNAWGRIFTLAAGLLLLASLAACNLPGGAPPAQPAEVDGESDGADEPPPPPPADAGGAAPQGMELAECPPPPNLLWLKFSADIVFTSGVMNLTHNLGDGVLTLVVTSGEPDFAIQSQGSASMPVTISGSMDDCTLQGESSMTASASGFCRGGVVYLTIQENWQAGSGSLTCPEQDPAPFPIPAVGVMTHTGAGGNGEAFYLDKGFSEHSTGSMLEKPFAGQGGSGMHTWTLLMDPIPLLPLVTP